VIIRPFKEAAPETYDVYYDEFGNQMQDIFKRLLISHPNKSGRMEKLTKVFNSEDGTDCLFKECGVGSIEVRNGENELSFEDYSCLVTERKTGDYIMNGGWTPRPLPTSNFSTDGITHLEVGYIPYPVFCFAPLDSREWTIKEHKPFNAPWFIDDLIDSEVNSYEMIFQLPYVDTIGLINSFFTTWTYTHPFEAYIIIDMKRKLFNVPKLRFHPGISKEVMTAIYIKLLTDIDILINYVYRVMEKEKSFYSIKVFLYPFGSIIRLHLEDYHEYKYLNSPDQVKSIIKCVRAGGIRYFENEGLHILRGIGMDKTPIENALDCCDILSTIDDSFVK
jgi:hypothetical protein